jgi:predicted PurR-regulated permease PerM
MHLPETPDGLTAPDGSVRAASPIATPARVTVAITPRSIWFAAGVVLALLALVVLVTKALNALVLVFIAIILGEAIRPIVAKLQQRRIPQPLAVLLIYLGVAIILAVFLWILLNPVVKEVGVLATQFPSYVTNIQKWLAGIAHNLSTNPPVNNAIQQLSSHLATLAQQAIPTLVSVPLGILAGVFGFLINTVIVLTMTLFWLGSSARFKAFMVGLFPPARRELVSTVIAGMSKSLGGWVLGTLVAMVLIGTLTGLGLLILGVPYALLLGIVAGLTEVIPYLGPWISGSISVVVTLVTTGSPLKALAVIVLFLIIQEVEGNVVQPLVMHRAVHLDPWLVIVALLIGGELLGLIGVILAVPVAAVLQVVTLQVVAPAIRLATDQGSAMPLPDQPERIQASPQGS